MKKIKHIRLNNTDYRIDGDSAYEVAVANGFKGTEQEWLDSLTGGAITQAAGHAANAAVYRERAETACLAAEEARAAAEGHTADQIRAWLDDHPEATTTVQDGSLTIDKMVVGSLGYVTPEMFGAKGDGVTDDTEALKNCLKDDTPIIVAQNRYKITRTLYLTKSKTIAGGGIFYMPSSETTRYLFSVEGTADKKVPYVEIDNITFETDREHPLARPVHGEIPEGGLASNIHLISLLYADTVLIKNVILKNADYSLYFSNCNKITVDGFNSTGAGGTMYAQGNESVIIKNGYSEHYALVHASAHHFYVCHGNGEVIIENVKMAGPAHAGEYPVHVYASDDQIAEYGLTKKVSVRNCYIEHRNRNAVSMMVSERFTIEGCTFAGLDAGKYSSFFFNNAEGHAPLYEISGSTFKQCQGFSLASTSGGAVGAANFTNCLFDCMVGTEGVMPSAELVNCKMTKFWSLDEATGSVALKNCIIDKPDTFALRVANTSPIKLVNCYLRANYSGGLLAVRNANANVTLIGCYGENDGGTRFDSNSGTSPRVKIYNCVFPTLVRDANADFVGEYNTFAG